MAEIRDRAKNISPSPNVVRPVARKTRFELERKTTTPAKAKTKRTKAVKSKVQPKSKPNNSKTTKVVRPKSKPKAKTKKR